MTKTPYEIELETKLMRAWSDTVLSEFKRKEALAALADLDQKVHSGYDFNADLDGVTMKVGRLLTPPQKAEKE